MSLPELEQLLKDLLIEVKKMKIEDRPLVVCLPNSNKGYFVKTY